MQRSMQFFAIYAKANDRPHLVLKRRADTNELAAALQAANGKARELGWIV
jgi:hypothetical protein